MYSVINVDITPLSFTDFYYGQEYTNSYVSVAYNSIIMGSSTVNEDSAHSEGSLHNYVSFYVKSIEIKYDITFIERGIDYFNDLSGYIILFKLPYKNNTEIEKILFSRNPKDFILYSHPECILAYNVHNLNTKTSHTSHVLKYNKPFIVRPDYYVGICYFLPSDRNYSQGYSKYNIPATAKVIFKPQ